MIHNTNGPDVKISWLFPNVPESRRVRRFISGLKQSGFDVAYASLSEGDPYVMVRNPERSELTAYLNRRKGYQSLILEGVHIVQ